MNVATSDNSSAAYPFQFMFLPFPFVCFTLTLLTDLAFVATSNFMWQNFSAWLLFAGLAFGMLCLIAGFLDLLRPRTRPLRPGFLAIVCFLLMLLLSFLNSLVHAGDGWTAVVPYGVALSAVTVVFAIVTVTLSSRKYAKLAWRV